MDQNTEQRRKKQNVFATSRSVKLTAHADIALAGLEIQPYPATVVATFRTAVLRDIYAVHAFLLSFSVTFCSTAFIWRVRPY